MKEERRVGTFTLGLTLLIFGILFGLHLFLPKLDYLFIFRLWPLVFIILGCEIIISNLKFKTLTFRYDFAAIFMIGLLMVFAMGMAGVDYLIQHCNLQHCPNYIDIGYLGGIPKRYLDIFA